MASITPDIFLKVAELVDLDTVSALMRTSKASQPAIFKPRLPRAYNY